MNEFHHTVHHTQTVAATLSSNVNSLHHLPINVEKTVFFFSTLVAILTLATITGVTIHTAQSSSYVSGPGQLMCICHTAVAVPTQLQCLRI